MCDQYIAETLQAGLALVSGQQFGPPEDILKFQRCCHLLSIGPSIDWLLPTLVLLSTSAQYCVKPHLVREFGQAERDKSLLRGKERSLRIKDAQVAVNSLCIAFI